MKNDNTITFLAPTKVPVKMSAEQLVSSLGLALFGEPEDIKEATGMNPDEVDFYIWQEVVGKGDEEMLIQTVCYDDKDGNRQEYDDRGQLYIRWYNLVRAIIPNIPPLQFKRKPKEGGKDESNRT